MYGFNGGFNPYSWNQKAVLRKMPVITQLLEPAHRLAEEITKIEKRVAEIKKNHPDFIMAFKLQILLRKYEEMMDREDITPSDYEFIRRKYDQTRLTLHHHIQDKLRIAQRAFAPEMLELAQSHLGLSRHQEKILLIKQDLLETAQEHTHHTLQNLAQILRKPNRNWRIRSSRIPKPRKYRQSYRQQSQKCLRVWMSLKRIDQAGNASGAV